MSDAVHNVYRNSCRKQQSVYFFTCTFLSQEAVGFAPVGGESG